jgi:hypothetical protein
MLATSMEIQRCSQLGDASYSHTMATSMTLLLYFSKPSKYPECSLFPLTGHFKTRMHFSGDFKVTGQVQYSFRLYLKVMTYCTFDNVSRALCS